MTPIKCSKGLGLCTSRKTSIRRIPPFWSSVLSGAKIVAFPATAAILLAFGSSVLGAANSTPAQSPDPKATVKKETAATKEFKRPPYNTVLRWKENWSGLRGLDTSTTGDLFDPVKFIPLNTDGSIWLSFGGSVRGRVENWNNFNFVPGVDATYFLYHSLLDADLHITNFVRVYVEGIDAESTPRDLPGGLRITDVNSIDLNQGFVDLIFPVGDGTLALRGGLQALAFGKQRLVGPSPWANAYRHWDGFSAILDIHGIDAQAFWTEYVPVQKYHFDEPDGQTKLYGIYATSGKPVDPLGYDLYFLGLNREDPVTFNGTTGPEQRYTIGGRLFGAPHDFDYDLESAYQFGHVGSGDVSAWMLAADGGYTFKKVCGTPRLGLGFDYASGDSAKGGNVGTFDQLFPSAHAYFGYIDEIGRQNIIDIHPGLTLKAVSQKLTLKAEGHFFWRAQAADALYNAAGGVVRRGAPGTSTDVGSEVDLVANYRFNRHIAVEPGYCHFFPGKFIQQTGPDSPINFFYFQSEFYF